MQDLIGSLEQTRIVVSVSGLIILLLIESLHPFFDFFKGSIKKRGLHFFSNITLGAVNAIMNAAFFVGLWFWASTFALNNDFGLLNWLSLIIPEIPLWLITLLAIFLFDFFMYVWHRINHSIPFLWKFHRVHHSDSKMDVSTATRFHTGEILFSSLLRIPIILLFGFQIWQIFLYELIAFVVIQFHHANIGLPDKIDKILRLFIVTPHMHKVHHSKWQPETDSNFSTIFSFWDRIWNTFRLHDPLKTIELGLEEFDEEKDQKISSLFKIPFK